MFNVPWWKKAVTFMSGGMVNPTNHGVVFKDPYTGVGNLFAHLNDHINHKKDEGVWIGKRLLKNSPVGFAGFTYEFLNLNVLHYAFRIDGNAYNLERQENGQFKIKPLQQDEGDFEWFYKGETKRSMFQIKMLIDKVNSYKLKYNLFIRNCITSARAFEYYACGSYSEMDVIRKLAPGIEEKKDLLAQIQSDITTSFSL